MPPVDRDLTGIVENAVLKCSLPLPEAYRGAASRLLSLSFDELGFDSLNYMEFCIAIATDTGVEFEHRRRQPSPVAGTGRRPPEATGMTPFVLATLERLSTCKTETDYYPVRISVTQYATPRDLETLLNHPATQRHAQFCGWLDEQLDLALLQHASLSDAVLVSGRDSISFYSERPGRDTLLIGFCGRAQLLFLPTAVVLQYFGRRADFLVLRDLKQRGFEAGIADYAEGFANLITALEREFEFGRYTHIRCMGSSGGGAAALAAGAVLGRRKDGHLQRSLSAGTARFRRG